MRKPIILCSFAISVAAFSAQAFHDWPHSFREGGHMAEVCAPVTGAPYSAEETVKRVHMLANGNRITHTQQVKVYRDSQGRTRTERSIAPPPASGRPAFKLITIADPVAGQRYILNASTMTAYQMPLRPAPAGTPAGSCVPQHPPLAGVQVSTVDLGTKTINGMSAAGKQVTETIPAGAIGNEQPIKIVREVWTSSALKAPVEVKITDPRFGTIEKQMTNIVQTEPDASLFVVPPNYTMKTGGFGSRSRSAPKPPQ